MLAAELFATGRASAVTCTAVGGWRGGLRLLAEVAARGLEVGEVVRGRAA